MRHLLFLTVMFVGLSSVFQCIGQSHAADKSLSLAAQTAPHALKEWVYLRKPQVNHKIIKMNNTQNLMNYLRSFHQETVFKVVPYKKLRLRNLNTNEDLDITFWAEGRYVPGALDRLNYFMRDWRDGEVVSIDPKLFHLIYDLNNKLGQHNNRIELISGHRSQATNNVLRAAGGGQAKKSQHVLGKAADIRIPGISLEKLRDEALNLRRGGVGYYPESGFVHVDTGPVRQW